VRPSPPGCTGAIERLFCRACAARQMRAVCARGAGGLPAFAFPVFWLVLDLAALNRRLLHRGTEFTIDNFGEVTSQAIVLGAGQQLVSRWCDGASLGVTATSGCYVVSLQGAILNTWFSLDLFFAACPMPGCCRSIS
jgi:hypothetical protein